MWSSIQLVSVLGSLLVLVAYVASQFGYLSAKGLAFAYANIVGSGILAVVAALEAQWGFLLLEVAWALVSVVAVVRQRAKPNSHRDRRVSDRRVAALGRVIRRMQEHRANLTYQDLSHSADELRFELFKGLV
jgi:membrane protein implicated in regulation of membrane protease activity